MCATLFYTKLIKSKLYPRAARTGTCAFAQGVGRINGKIVSKYLGIVRQPEKANIVETNGEKSLVRGRARSIPTTEWVSAVGGRQRDGETSCSNQTYLPSAGTVVGVPPHRESPGLR